MARRLLSGDNGPHTPIWSALPDGAPHPEASCYLLEHVTVSIAELVRLTRLVRLCRLLAVLRLNRLSRLLRSTLSRSLSGHGNRRIGLTLHGLCRNGLSYTGLSHGLGAEDLCRRIITGSVSGTLLRLVAALCRIRALGRVSSLLLVCTRARNTLSRSSIALRSTIGRTGCACRSCGIGGSGCLTTLTTLRTSSRNLLAEEEQQDQTNQNQIGRAHV